MFSSKASEPGVNNFRKLKINHYFCGLQKFNQAVMTYFEKVKKIADDIQKLIGDFQPEVGLITGTGLGDIVNEFELVKRIPYGEIEGFPVSTVQSHAGEMVFSTYKGVKIVTMRGRLHYYEGYSMKEVTLPVRVLKELGVSRLFISNVTGSVNPDYEMGDVVFIRDHINMMPENPLRGKNIEEWGPRFPDMKYTYNPEWNATGVKEAKALGLRVHEGVYVALPGPNLETPAEYIFMNKIGADVVGMSTVPEVLAAKHMELPVLVFSLISNKCFPPEAIRETSVEDVISVGASRSPLLQKMVCRLIETIK